jgi:hypothetical protein
MGFANFYRKFIREYSGVLILLTDVIVLAESQAVNTGKRDKPLGQNVYGTGRITG